MFKKFYPYEYIKDVFSIDYKKLYNSGFKAVIFDIDNTLVHHGDDSNEKIDELFKVIHNTGLKTLLLSNNSAQRIERFKKNIDTVYIAEADKPSTQGYIKALDVLGVKKEEAVMVGDQLFTDIYGANRCKIASILVRFLQRDSETKLGKKRMVEKAVLYFYCKSNLQHRLGNITKEKSDMEYVLEKR